MKTYKIQFYSGHTTVGQHTVRARTAGAALRNLFRDGGTPTSFGTVTCDEYKDTVPQLELPMAAPYAPASGIIRNFIL